MLSNGDGRTPEEIRPEDIERIHGAAKKAKAEVRSGILDWNEHKIYSRLVYLRAGQNLSNKGIAHGSEIPSYLDEIFMLDSIYRQRSIKQ